MTNTRDAWDYFKVSYLTFVGVSGHKPAFFKKELHPIRNVRYNVIIIVRHVNVDMSWEKRRHVRISSTTLVITHIKCNDKG